MKEGMAKKGKYIGAGVGIVLFAVFGILWGSFLGGVMGLNVAGALFGEPLASGVLQRMMVAAFMLLGVMVAGMIFVVGSSTVGWLLGTLADGLTHRARDEKKV